MALAVLVLFETLERSGLHSIHSEKLCFPLCEISRILRRLAIAFLLPMSVLSQSVFRHYSSGLEERRTGTAIEHHHYITTQQPHV